MVITLVHYRRINFNLLQISILSSPPKEIIMKEQSITAVVILIACITTSQKISLLLSQFLQQTTTIQFKTGNETLQETNNTLKLQQQQQQQSLEDNQKKDGAFFFKEEDDAPPVIPITGFKVIGERNSGTNYIQNLLDEATNYTKQEPQFLGLFKHLWGRSLFNGARLRELEKFQDILWVIMVRKPCDWADGMYRKPWHMCKPTNPSDCTNLKFSLDETKSYLKGITREEFFDLPWYDSVDMKFGGDFVYSNVFELRTHKLRKMKQLVELFPHRSIIVDYETVKKAPAHFINDLVRQFNVTLNPNYAPELMNRQVHQTLCLNKKEWELAQKHIDWNIEGLFGCHRLQCHMCTGE